MIRFPASMRHHERRTSKEKERELAMRGWRETSGAQQRDFALLHSLPPERGRHFIRSEIARGRGQTHFKG